MTDTGLMAPEHLRGPLPVNVDPALLAARDGWALARLGEGHSCRLVAKALGVSASAVYLATRRARERKMAQDLEQAGARVGDQEGRKVGPRLRKFQVTLDSPTSGLVSHVIRAVDAEAAGLRGLKCYPEGTILAGIRMIAAEDVA